MLQVELLMFPYFSGWVAGDGVVVGVLILRLTELELELWQSLAIRMHMDGKGILRDIEYLLEC